MGAHIRLQAIGAQQKPRAKGPSMIGCKKCGKCCEVIAFNMPDSNISDPGVRKWLDYHEMQINEQGTWFFPCRCIHLRPDKLCDIYENRPDNCRMLPSNEIRQYQPPGCRFFEEEGQGIAKGLEVEHEAPIAFPGQDEVFTQR